MFHLAQLFAFTGSTRHALKFFGLITEALFPEKNHSIIKYPKYFRVEAEEVEQRHLHDFIKYILIYLASR